jgi:hypothetical protein
MARTLRQFHLARIFAGGLLAAAAWVGIVGLFSPVAAAQTYEQPLPIAAGATTTVALSQSNILTCTPPGSFQPNPTVWTVSTSEVQLGGLPAADVVPAPGHPLSVTVSSNLQPGQGFFISWTGNTDCATFNGIMYFKVCDPVACPVGAPPGSGGGGDGSGGGGSGSEETPSTGSCGTSKTKPKGGKGAPAKRGILSDKSKQCLARTAQRLLGYASNAEAIANACVLGGIKKEALKASLKAVAKDLAVSQVPIVNQIPTDPCSMTMGAFTGILRLEALGLVTLAQDPPRKRYRSRVKARVKVPISIHSTAAATAPLAKTLTDVIKLNARAKAYLTSMLVANERMQGAQKARDARWRKIHERAARKFAKRAAEAIAAVRKRGIKLADQLSALGYDQAPTAEQLQQATSIGLAAPQDSLLRVLGVGKRQRRALAKGVTTASPPRTSLAQSLRETASSLDAAVTALRGIT